MVSELEITTVKVPAIVSIPRRMRFRIWRERMLFRLRFGRKALNARDRLARIIDRELERRVLFGTVPTTSGYRTEPDPPREGERP